MKETAQLKVLVIDDSHTARVCLQRCLLEAGYEVILAQDGYEALVKVAETIPDVILCDIMMPRLDGYQTCIILKNNPELQNIPVIMVTARDGLFDRARGKLVGSVCYITKPFTDDEILQSVQSLFGATA
jgi:twitching motility two-component system response regulator PilG